jgi:hypothetical protein
VTARDELAAIIEANRTTVTHWVDDSQDPPEHGSSLLFCTGHEIADAILARWPGVAGAIGSCPDCHANLATNGGQHMFWCGRPDQEPPQIVTDILRAARAAAGVNPTDEIEATLTRLEGPPCGQCGHVLGVHDDGLGSFGCVVGWAELSHDRCECAAYDGPTP